MTVVLDAGAISALAGPAGGVLVRALVDTARWPPTIPTAVLVESRRGNGPRDARANRLIRLAHVVALDERLARRAAALRSAAAAGSAVDAIVVATAEALSAPVLTADIVDIRALAAHADGVVAVAV